MGKWLAGQSFAYIKEVESAANGYFEKIDGSYYKHDIEAREHRREKFIGLKGNYVEK